MPPVKLIWLAVVSAQVFMLLFLGVSGQRFETEEPAQQLAGLLFMVGWVALVLVVPIAYFIRNQIYKAHWRQDAVSDEGYVQANLIFFALLELPAILGFVSAFIEGRLLPGALPMAVVLGLLLLNYPHGRPKLDASPRLGVPEKRNER
ncbi:hypothetical protein [Algisphaera agarilytica]|uniref:Uncharacterized protein n=1 Tax=Algisphaera agarilytica TaxID=1385975 RepID=A0A7X0H6X2_9BACT|nr:hypothetical protein [Algisphaera agarilytica]MBB6428920.1 hypothetical protein [Algisphaera agarilytica]